MSTLSSYKDIENKHDSCRSQDHMKKNCESLGEYAIKMNNLRKKKMKLLTKVIGKSKNLLYL